jgi:hypothetical protein
MQLKMSLQLSARDDVKLRNSLLKSLGFTWGKLQHIAHNSTGVIKREYNIFYKCTSIYFGGSTLDINIVLTTPPPKFAEKTNSRTTLTCSTLKCLDILQEFREKPSLSVSGIDSRMKLMRVPREGAADASLTTIWKTEHCFFFFSNYIDHGLELLKKIWIAISRDIVSCGCIGVTNFWE